MARTSLPADPNDAPHRIIQKSSFTSMLFIMNFLPASDFDL